ncbi:MAG TPA: pilus assembly protein PilP [Chromatiales bacterium]|nr:pilus assembly protein PilP [Thiotrichales bacterium]HIP68777.1 pilus assembly protein PilP [Chromatiales bacterium]
MSYKNIFHLSILALAGILMSGCGSDMDKLQAKIEKVKAQPPSEIEPIPEIRTYHAFEYPGHDRDPFDPDIMAAAISPTSIQPKSSLSIDTNRVKEYLESFPLDSLKMVGTLTRKGLLTGLVQTPDGTIQRVVTGNYAGQNYGKITKIAENEISLIEIIPDGFGGYMERPATIALSEEK